MISYLRIRYSMDNRRPSTPLRGRIGKRPLEDSCQEAYIRIVKNPNALLYQ